MLARTRVHIEVMHPNPIVAAGLEATFDREPGFEVRRFAAPVGSLTTAERDAAGSAVRVIVADYLTALDLFALNGTSAALDAQAGQGIRVLALASANCGWQVRNALESGVHGVVSSECPLVELVEAVRRIHDGERYLCAIASRCMADSFAQQRLTPRELEVLRLVARGLDNKTIARRLVIALGTVKAHMRTLLDKLDATSRTEAVNEGVKRGFIGESVAFG